MTHRDERRRLRASIVSRNSETIDGLESYLRSAGVDTTSTRDIGRIRALANGATAVVIFPDDFNWETVISMLMTYARDNHQAVAVIVTRNPRQFDGLCWPKDAAQPIILPKPAWGWTILDAIRTERRGAATRRSP